MTHDTKNRVLHTGVYQKIDLTTLENKLLICLSSGNVRTYKEISKYLYGFCSKHTIEAVRNHVSILKRKSKKRLNIKVIRGIGYRLDSEIYFK